MFWIIVVVVGVVYWNDVGVWYDGDFGGFVIGIVFIYIWWNDGVGFCYLW